MILKNGQPQQTPDDDSQLNQSIGQQLNQQFPQGRNYQQTASVGGDDQLESLKQRLAQEATPPPQQKSSGVKGLLQNFFTGFGNAAMHEAGIPTPYERQQKALSDLTTVTNAQAMQQFHQAQMAQYQPVPLVGLDQKPILGPDGKVITLPAAHAQTFYAGLQAAAAKIQAAQETAEHKTITVPGVGAFNWDAQQGKYAPVQGAQIPQHQLAPGEAEKLGFPAGTTQIPESLYAQAARLSGTTATRTQFLPDGAGGYIQVQNTSTRQFNAPSATSKPSGTGGNAAPNQNAAPPKAGTPGRVFGVGAIYATDATTGDTVQTTPQEVAQSGGRLTNPRKVQQGQIAADQKISNRLVDVATKLNRYEDSLNTPISENERGNISGILGSDKFRLGAFGAEIPVDRMNQALDVENWNSLSPSARNRVISYYNMREAIQGYQSVLAAGGHGSDLGMTLNLTAVPSPVLPEDVGREGIRQFKENLPIAARGVPTTPGQQSVRDILNRGNSNVAPTSGGGFKAWKAKQKP